jgi:hypothetical protein
MREKEKKKKYNFWQMVEKIRFVTEKVVKRKYD